MCVIMMINEMLGIALALRRANILNNYYYYYFGREFQFYIFAINLRYDVCVMSTRFFPFCQRTKSRRLRTDAGTRTGHAAHTNRNHFRSTQFGVRQRERERVRCLKFDTLNRPVSGWVCVCVCLSFPHQNHIVY